MHVCTYYDFFSNFMIILLCEIFISYPKSGSETVTYLVELYNNFNIPAMSRIPICSFLLNLSSPNVKQTATVVALQGPEIQSTRGISQLFAHKRDHAFKGWAQGLTRCRSWNQGQFFMPLSCPFFLCTKMHICTCTASLFPLEECCYILEELSLTLACLTLL